MELDLGQRTTFKFRLGEEVYTVTKPTVKQIAEFSASMKDVKDAQEDLDLTNKWLVGLGFKEDFLNSLEKEMYTKVLETVMGIKKN